MSSVQSLPSIATHTVTGRPIRKPYHLTGQSVASYAEAVARVGFAIQSRPVVNPFTLRPQPDDVGVYRTDTNDCLGVHSPTFTYRQPADSLALMERATQALKAQWCSASALRGGKQIAAFATLDTCITAPKRGDKVGLSILFTDFFDGSGRMGLRLCCNVLACDNGIVTAQNLCAMRGKHTPNLNDKVDVFAGTLEYNLQLQLDEVRATIGKLDNTPMVQGEVEPFARALLGIAADTKAADMSGIQRGKLEAITTGFTRGTGNVGRTRWDMLNSVTEYLDHAANYRATDTTREENRFISLTNEGGDASKLRARAMELLLN